MAQFQQWMSHAKQWRAQNTPEHSIQMKGQELELRILDFIGFDWWTGGGITAQWLTNELDSNKHAKFIRLLLNSPGGDYFEGVAIHNLLKRHSAKVIVEIIGEASSAASVIAMAGDEVQIHHGAMLMIHEASSGVWGNASDFESGASMLRAVNESAIDIYVARTGMDRAEVSKLVTQTTWIKADTAIDQGWADKLIPATAKQSTSNQAPTQRSAPGARHSADQLATFARSASLFRS